MARTDGVTPTSGDARPAQEVSPDTDACPVCGSVALLPLRCKVICRGCRTIVQSCADL